MAKRLGRKGKRAAVAAEAENPTLKFKDKGLTDQMLQPYNPLTPKAVTAVIDAAIEILVNTGIGFEADDEIALTYFRDAGCIVNEEGLVKFPEKLIRDSLASCARTIKLWNRPGTEYIDLDHHHTWFFSGMTCIQVYDEKEEKGVRSSTKQDLIEITRLVDALPNIDGACVSCKIVEESNIHGEIDEFAVLASNTTKPLEFLCEFPETFDVVVEMASAIRGGKDKLAEKPYFAQVITPLPLFYAKSHTHQIIEGVKAGVPVVIGTVTMGGASAPITLAGCLTHALATDLGALVLSQLVQEGSYCMLGSDVSFMEAATGGLGGFSQMYLGDQAICQVMRSMDMPSATGLGGWAAARRFNQDAVWEISTNMMSAFYVRPATVDYCGSLDEGITYSKHALAFCDEMIGLMRKMWEGIQVDDEMLARELSAEAGPLGNYLSHPHTAKHCREEYWNAKYFGANYPMNSGSLPDEDLIERIENDIQQIEKTHQAEPLDPLISAEIQAIQDKFKETYSVKAA
ncbi:trimethylamine methyltransferase family protein [Curvivirga sp.]|uniref:trimethylamine methyltransferase family protein n=1 Tax=Curvivirga sp. TaxID=2856848 RepID=UPI003B5A3F84